MQNIKLLNHFFKDFSSYLKTKNLVKIIFLNTVQGLTNGIGVLLLIPLVQLLNNSGNSSVNKITEYIQNIFNILSIPLNIYTIIGVYILLVTIVEVIRYFQQVFTTQAMQGYNNFLRSKLFNAVVHAEWSYLQQKRKSDYIHSITQDVNKIGTTTYNLLNISTSLFVILFNIIAAFFIDFKFTLLTLIFSSILLLLSRVLFRKAHEAGKKNRFFFKDLFHQSEQMLDGLKEVKSHSLEDEHTFAFNNKSNEIVKHITSFVKIQAFTKTGHNIFSVVVLGGYFIGAVTFFNLDISVLLVLIFIFSRLIPRFTMLVTQWQLVMNNLPAFTGVNKALNEIKNNSEKIDPLNTELHKFRKEIEFKKLSFSYEKENSFSLTNINLIILKGSLTAFAGESGCGKTTIIDLIIGLLKPQSGAVLIDGQALENKNLVGWRKSISYVTQESYFNNDSIRNNLLFGIKKDISDEELYKTLKICSLSSFVKSLPDKLDSQIGDRGTKLSGGEKQRLAIARALLRKPELLILDEATSALDYKNESIIYDLIQKLKGKITIIVIAHRLSTIKCADKIYVMKSGHIIENGNWQELNHLKDGFFKNLIKIGALSNE